MAKSTKYLQVLTGLSFSLILASCGAVKVEPVEEGESLRYHARVGYFLHPPQRLKSKYVKNLNRYSDISEFKRCEPSAIIRLHARFERRYVEVKQDNKFFLFDTIAGKPLELTNGKYILLDKYFKKEFPLPTDKIQRMGVMEKKSDLICKGKVWVGMNKNEFLITRPPADNIRIKKRGKVLEERWQYEDKDFFLTEYRFENGILKTHNDSK
ncbi:MAG: hypothetical protein CME70_14200 [Halobacteriovorax sp.]|nr:hypothetical protein [Halobacteriovorax sp.]|tara:strand:- start:300342 stop:300974 length:633 start_codon:yes stop_codon:yes gene_type:complete